MTHAIDIAATPEAIWPWLVQMGCRRGGFYSIDVLDNGGRRSAREIHPDLQTLPVHTVIPATPRGTERRVKRQNSLWSTREPNVRASRAAPKAGPMSAPAG